jgi:ADP-ribosylglycohydrolase
LSSNGVCFDIGNTVKAALYQFQQTGDPVAGSTDPKTAGNGSLMRLAPVPLVYAARPVVAIEKAAESSRTTHGAVVAVDACRYYAALIVGALEGAGKEELLSVLYSPTSGGSQYWSEHPLCPEIDAIARGSFRAEPPVIKGTGYAAKSLEAALWAFYKSTTFADGCLLAVNLGDDADTTAAIYGQLAGAFYGVEGIPAKWLESLALRETLEKFALDLHALSVIGVED